MSYTVKFSKISLLIFSVSLIFSVDISSARAQDQQASSRRGNRLKPELLRMQQVRDDLNASPAKLQPIEKPSGLRPMLGKSPTLAPLPMAPGVRPANLEAASTPPVSTLQPADVAKVSLLESNSSRRSHRIPSEVVGSANQPNAPTMATMPVAVKSGPPQIGSELGQRVDASNAASMSGDEARGLAAQPVKDIGKANGKSQLTALSSEQSQPRQAASSTKAGGTSMNLRDDIQPTAPQARVAKKVEPIRGAKPLPRLANPEQFRVNNGSRRFYQDFQEKVESPSGGGESFARKIPPSLQDKEATWLDNLPRPSLTSGVAGQPFQRAASNRETDALLAFSRQAEMGMDYRMDQANVVKTWRSPNLSHRPIYFEDENLERYGNGYGRFQPLVSGAKFFSTAVFLPYHIGVQPPNDCVYEMGYLRPGDCNPAFGRQRELNRRGVFNQLMAVGFVFGGL